MTRTRDGWWTLVTTPVRRDRSAAGSTEAAEDQMTEHSPPGSAPIVISISADVPLRILRTTNGFVIDVGDLVQIRGVSYHQMAGAGAALVDAYIPGDPVGAIVDAAQATGRAWARRLAGWSRLAVRTVRGGGTSPRA